jgi:hypothetical protein
VTLFLTAGKGLFAADEAAARRATDRKSRGKGERIMPPP